MRTQRSAWFAYGVLALSLSLTAAVAAALYRAGHDRDRARFENAVDNAHDRIRSRLDTYLALLVATASYVEAADPVALREYRKYVQGLGLQQHYPGIQGIGLSRYVPASELGALEEDMRRQGQIAFRVWPRHARDEYHAIVFLEPMDPRNAAAIGYDMFSEPIRREAMARARHTGLPAASRKVTLVQEIDPRDQQAGFLIYVPVHVDDPAETAPHSREFYGHVYSPFRIEDLFTGIFGSERTPGVAFEVFDGTTPNPRHLMHRSIGARAAHEPRFSSTLEIDVAGTPWTLMFHSTAVLDRGGFSLSVLPGLVGVGLAASLAFFLLVRAQARARARAEASEQKARHERRRAEVEHENLHALFMQAPAAVAIIRGPELRYELSNSQNDRLSGNRQLMGKTVPEALPELEAQGFTQLARQAIATGEPIVGSETPIVLKDAVGGERTAFLSGVYQPLRGADGSVDGIMAFAYDVTEQVLARRKVEDYARELAKAVRIRDDFLSIAGHELKTPLSALTLQLQLLERHAEKGRFDGNVAPLVERLGKAVAHTARLDGLVGELLDVSKITTGRLALQLEEIDLRALLNDLVEQFSEQVRRANSSMTLEAPDRVVGRWDRSRLEQVISNLLANAIKYAPGKPIDISLERRETCVRLTVTDHGIGIAAEDLERVFERFERAVPEQHYGGLGLGLWISRQIVEAHGGKIFVESVPNEYTSFIVELPLETASGHDSATESTTPLT